MKPSNREEAKAGKPLVTRDGRKVIYYHDSGLEIHLPILVLIDGYDTLMSLYEDGKYTRYGDSEYDLFMDQRSGSIGGMYTKKTES